MGGEDEARGTPGYEAHWELAKAAWVAEEENARRLATRRALIVGIPLAGAAFSRPLAEPAGVVVDRVKAGDCWAITCLVFAVLTATCMFLILVKAFPIRKTRKRPYKTSSDGLNPVRKNKTIKADIDGFLVLSENDARVAAITRMLRATHRLNRQNVRLAQRQQYALEWVALALLGCLLAGLAYIKVGAPADDTAGQGLEHRPDEGVQSE